MVNNPLRIWDTLYYTTTIYFHRYVKISKRFKMYEKPNCLKNYDVWSNDWISNITFYSWRVYWGWIITNEDT